MLRVAQNISPIGKIGKGIKKKKKERCFSLSILLFLSKTITCLNLKQIFSFFINCCNYYLPFEQYHSKTKRKKNYFKRKKKVDCFLNANLFIIDEKIK
jgi:hypothetical protein